MAKNKPKPEEPVVEQPAKIISSNKCNKCAKAINLGNGITICKDCYYEISRNMYQAYLSDIERYETFKKGLLK